MATLDTTITSQTRYVKSDTTEGSTVFVDASGNDTFSNRVLITGGTHHTTARAKFGASSIAISGAADSLIISSSPISFPLGFHFWIYLTAFPSETKKILVGRYTTESEAENACYLSLSPAGLLTYRWFFTQADDSNSVLSSNIPLGEWVHVFCLNNYSSTYVYGEGYYDNYNGVWINGTNTQTVNWQMQLGVNGVVQNKTGINTSYYVNDIYHDIYLTPALIYRPPLIVFSNAEYWLDEVFVYDADILTGNFTPPTKTVSATPFYISGTVKKGDINVSRVVVAYDRVTGEVIGTATSDPDTGIYTISDLANQDMCYAECLPDPLNPDEPVLQLDRIIPKRI